MQTLACRLQSLAWKNVNNQFEEDREKSLGFGFLLLIISELLFGCEACQTRLQLEVWAEGDAGVAMQAFAEAELREMDLLGLSLLSD